MNDFLGWSIKVGSARGTQLRLHLFFLLFAVLVLFASSREEAGASVLLGVECVLVLCVSVLIHELGHAYAAHRLGGHLPQMVLVPWGGVAESIVPPEPQAEFFVAIAGPVASVCVAAFVCPILIVAGQEPLAILFRPLSPVGIVDNVVALECFKLALWVNWLLAIVNLLPVFPFDGGRALRALLWQAFEYRTAAQIAARVAKLGALALAILAFAWPNSFAAEAIVPPGVPLLLLSIVLYFSAQHELSRLEEMLPSESSVEYDFSQGYTSLERSVDVGHGQSPFRRWLEKRRAARRERQLAIESDEERQLDHILARLAEVGMDRLSAQERSLLERVSQRYRNRQC